MNCSIKQTGAVMSIDRIVLAFAGCRQWRQELAGCENSAPQYR
jgi:hypothetical protein